MSDDESWLPEAPPPPPLPPPPVFFDDPTAVSKGPVLAEHLSATASEKSASISAAIMAVEDRQFADKSETGFVGLSNQGLNFLFFVILVGATCYLNSLVQTLFMTPELRNALYKVITFKFY